MQNCTVSATSVSCVARSHPEELIGEAHSRGYHALALTDECSLAGVVRAHVAAKKVGLHLVIGTEVQLADGPSVVLLAPDARAYTEISRLITVGRRRCEKGAYRLDRSDLEATLTHALVIWLPGVQETDQAAVRWLARTFAGRVWIAVEQFYGGADRRHAERLGVLGAAFRVPLVACGDVHMHRRARYPIADTLRRDPRGSYFAGGGR